MQGTTNDAQGMGKPTQGMRVSTQRNRRAMLGNEKPRRRKNSCTEDVVRSVGVGKRIQETGMSYGRRKREERYKG